MNNDHTLTPEEWAQIPPEYIYSAVDYDGEQYAYIDKPELSGVNNYWITTSCAMLLKEGPRCDNWHNSLQQRPAPAEQPTTPPTPEKKCVSIETTMEKLGQLAIAFGVPVTFEKPGFCADYYSVMVFGLNREPIVHFTCPAPTLPEFNDDGIELLVRTYEKIKIN